jgi:large subunit ribosomal protein L21
MYAIVKTGGKQYRVSEGQSLLVERLRGAAEGSSVELEPLLFVDGSDVVDGEALASVTVAARVVGHERGPKLRVVKFKPKRGYKRRTGHRQELTRIEVTSVGRSSGGSGRGSGRSKSRSRKAAAAAPESTGATSESAAGASTESAAGASTESAAGASTEVQNGS